VVVRVVDRDAARVGAVDPRRRHRRVAQALDEVGRADAGEDAQAGGDDAARLERGDLVVDAGPVELLVGGLEVAPLELHGGAGGARDAGGVAVGLREGGAVVHVGVEIGGRADADHLVGPGGGSRRDQDVLGRDRGGGGQVAVAVGGVERIVLGGAGDRGQGEE